MVNLRHHVAGVVIPTIDGRVCVQPAYEADYTYVATAFIESIRRGLDLCGLPPDSRAGRDLASPLCTLLADTAARTASPLLHSISQLFRFLSAASRVPAAGTRACCWDLLLGMAARNRNPLVSRTQKPYP